MNININNYETWFLMYVDNELCAREKTEVEQFIEKYPDLQAELELLQAAVLELPQGDTLDKSSLFRSENLDINLQEAMLLRLDNALDSKEEEALASMLAGNDHLQKSWNDLQQTKLDAAELIPFPNKAALYHNEKGRLVSMAFVRWSVAAAVLLAGLFGAVRLLNNEPATDIPVAIGPKPIEDTGNVLNNMNPEVPPANTSENLAQVVTEPSEKMPGKEDRLQKQATAQIVAYKDAAVPQQQPVHKAQENNTAEAPLVTQLSPMANNETPAFVITPKPKPSNEIIDLDVTPVKESYAKLALLDEPEANTDRILLLREEDVAKSKAGAFFKKLKRTVARTANINTGNSLKIAGFEFAVK